MLHDLRQSLCYLFIVSNLDLLFYKCLSTRHLREEIKGMPITQHSHKP